MADENTPTREAVLNVGEKLNPRGGRALVCAYENRILLGRFDLRGKEVLELGCGCMPASFGIKDEHMPARYLATDSERDLIAVARKLDPRPEFRVVSALTPESVGQTFDVLIMRGVLHHLPDPARALSELNVLLKPGGFILLYEPNLSCLPGNFAKWILERFFHLVLEASPYGQLSQPKIRRAVSDAGLEVSGEWYASLLAFPLTGDYGRQPILPDWRLLFRIFIWMDSFLSGILHASLPLASWFHWRVVFQVRKRNK